MKQTDQYKLNQWDPTDRILREDFNADNLKLETALAGKMEKIEMLEGWDAQDKTISVGSRPIDYAFKRPWNYVAMLIEYPYREDATAATIEYKIGSILGTHPVIPLGLHPYGPLFVLFRVYHDLSRPVQGLAISDRLITFQGDMPFSKAGSVILSADKDKRMACPKATLIGMP